MTINVIAQSAAYLRQVVQTSLVDKVSDLPTGLRIIDAFIAGSITLEEAVSYINEISPGIFDDAARVGIVNPTAAIVDLELTEAAQLKKYTGYPDLPAVMNIIDSDNSQYQYNLFGVVEALSDKILNATSEIPYSALNLTGSIQAADLAEGTITATQIAANANIVGSQIALNTISGSGTGSHNNIAPGSISTADIAANAVTNAKQGFGIWAYEICGLSHIYPCVYYFNSILKIIAVRSDANNSPLADCRDPGEQGDNPNSFYYVDSITIETKVSFADFLAIAGQCSANCFPRGVPGCLDFFFDFA